MDHFLKITLTISGFFILNFSVFSQTNIIDSLQNVAKTAKSDTIRVNALNELADRYRKKSDYEQALQNATAALTLGEKINFKRGVAKSNSHLGNIYRNKSQYDKSIEYYNRAIPLFKDLKDKYAIAPVTEISDLPITI